MQSSRTPQISCSTVVMPKLPTAAMRDIFLQVYNSSGDFDSAFSAMRAVAPESAEPVPPHATATSANMDAADIRLCRVNGKTDDGEPCAQCKPSGVCVHSGPCGYQKSADIEPMPIDDRVRTAKKLRYYGEVTPGCPDNPTRKLMRHAAELLMAPAEPVVSQATIDVLAERQRQMEVEGWSPEHDDSHTCGEMPSAAAAYSMLAAGDTEENVLRLWPWEKHWLKPGPARRMLVKATALNLAEIERLDRAGVAELPTC